MTFAFKEQWGQTLAHARANKTAVPAYECGGGNQLQHQTLRDYADAHGRDGLVARCLPSALVPAHVLLLAVFRHPLDRFISGIYYYAKNGPAATALLATPPERLSPKMLAPFLRPLKASEPLLSPYLNGRSRTAVLLSVLSCHVPSALGCACVGVG